MEQPTSNSLLHLIDSLNSFFPWRSIDQSGFLFIFFATLLIFLYVKLTRGRVPLPQGPPGVPTDTCLAMLVWTLFMSSVVQRLEILLAHLYQQAGSPVNVGEHGFLMIFKVVTSMLWGGSVEGEQRYSVAAEFRETVLEITEVLGKPNVSNFFLILARFDLQGIEKQMRELASRFDNIFEKMIDQGLKIDDGEEDESETSSLRSSLVLSNKFVYLYS
ncbi:unnamed protein product [Citrullus colocynthis]|uniref:Uncharacterized protein n=1 Tax=Citrullus colocynthis TaxID=252529 RepID=A0ABP0XWH1_9ROSI